MGDSKSRQDFSRSSLLRASGKEAALLLLLVVAATAVTWLARGNRLPLTADRDLYELEISVPVVDIQQALALFDEGNYFFVDTRKGSPSERETIPGAFLIRSDTLDDDLHEIVDIVYPEDPILLFGNGNLSEVAFVADLLLARGFEDILVLRGSISAWRDQGGEISIHQDIPNSEIKDGS